MALAWKLRAYTAHTHYTIHHTFRVRVIHPTVCGIWQRATTCIYYRALQPVLFFKVLIEPHTTHYAYFIGLFTCYQQATDLLDSVNKVHVQFLWYACVFRRNVTFGIFARNHLRLGLLYRVVVLFCFACHAAVKEFNVLVTWSFILFFDTLDVFISSLFLGIKFE